jgi:hypothetical protein
MAAMPKGPKGERRPADIIGASVMIARIATGEVALLSSPYDVPFSWRYNIARIFPNEAGIDRAEARRICDGALRLRNRVAHHEPIYHLPLQAMHNDLNGAVAAMCAGTAAFARDNCTFNDVLAAEPK